MKVVKHYTLGKKRRLTLVGEKRKGVDIMSVAFALKSPIDTFSKEIGETIAYNRLHHPKKDFSIAWFGLDFLDPEQRNFMSKITAEGFLDLVAEDFKENITKYVKGLKV